MSQTPYIKCPRCGGEYLPTSKCFCEINNEYMPGDLRQVNKTKVRFDEKIERIIYEAKISWRQDDGKNIEVKIYASEGKELIKRIKEII